MKVTDQLPNASSNLLCGLLVVVLWGFCGLASPSRAQQLVPDVSQTSEVAISKSLSKDHGSGIPQKRAPEPAAYANDKGDSVIKALNEKARSRALSSALAPGLGQIQNGQFWKAPLVWGGLGLSVYFIINNNNRYQEFAKAYRLRTVTTLLHGCRAPGRTGNLPAEPNRVHYFYSGRVPGQCD
jgi:hypothetical protein